jgi:hypothetical protein
MDSKIELMSKDALIKLWEKEWGEPLPTARPPNAKMDIYYPLTEFFVAIHDDDFESEHKGKPISYAGIGYKGGFITLGGDYTHKKYRKMGLATKINDKRLALSGPKIVGIVSKDPSYPIGKRVEAFSSRGFVINPTEEELTELLGDYDESVIAPFREFYNKHKAGEWAVKKSWTCALKKNGPLSNIARLKAKMLRQKYLDRILARKKKKKEEEE